MASRARQPNLSDVARHAGVSTGTVSNVLNHPHKVKEGTSARVARSIEILGFVRNTNASSLANGVSGNIGLIVTDLANSLFVEIARGAQTRSRAEGHNLLLAGSENDLGVQDANVDSFIGARVAGLLLAPMHDSTPQIERLANRHVPVVLINYDPGTEQACCVIVDNERVGYLAARHLIDTGRTRIAFVSSGDTVQPVRLRRAGVRRAVAESPGVVLEELHTADFDAGSGAKAAREVAARAPADRPDGVIGVSDNLAVGFIEQVSDLGVSVPGDMAVMGCDHNTSAPDCRLTLTTVAMRGQEMGAAAMSLLAEEILHGSGAGSGHLHRREVLEPHLIPHQSTAALESSTS
jgi:LacI family transcriptional regulator